jgi:hypothetical protein
MSERKSFQDLPGDENPQFLEDGLSIYKMLKDKYPNQSVEDLDNILNGICASLIILMKNQVAKDNHKNFIQLVYKVLTKNLND